VTVVEVGQVEALRRAFVVISIPVRAGLERANGAVPRAIDASDGGTIAGNLVMHFVCLTRLGVSSLSKRPLYAFGCMRPPDASSAGNAESLSNKPARQINLPEDLRAPEYGATGGAAADSLLPAPAVIHGVLP
jgi:hypothetical protein